MKNQNRFLCWDTDLMEHESNVRVEMHKPVKKNIALLCDDEWEGVHNGYGSIVRSNDGYRLYYRANNQRHMMDKTLSHGEEVVCVAESRDGIHFYKPNLGKFEYNGTKYNNIVFMREGQLDNFSFFFDENPSCPPEKRFKALSEYHPKEGGTRLRYYSSADGFDFKEEYDLDVSGTFDSFNVMLWDRDTEQYFLFYRALHKPAGGGDLFEWKGVDSASIVRDIRVATSKDFLHWEEHGMIRFGEDKPDLSLYTNQISKYYRSTDTFIGFPVRYCERTAVKKNFSYMPLGDRHENIAVRFGREGTAVTDCAIMTSRDGFHFNRRDEAFLTPGPEDRNNWWYGDCYVAYGLVETPADEEGAAPEISLYVGENYRIKNVNFRRYTIRLDGFFSWFAPFSGGEVLTKPLTVTGDTLRLNFASSAIGGVEVSVCDENGDVLEGYESYTIFGDSVDRPVEFEKSLSALRGKSVRLRFALRDCHLYSFIFE